MAGLSGPDGGGRTGPNGGRHRRGRTGPDGGGPRGGRRRGPDGAKQRGPHKGRTGRVHILSSINNIWNLANTIALKHLKIVAHADNKF
jgi:hypothetical protein